MLSALRLTRFAPSETDHRQVTGVMAGHPHALRHTFGTALAEAGVDLAVMRALLGHDDVGSAAACIYLAPARIRKEFTAARAWQRARQQG